MDLNEVLTSLTGLINSQADLHKQELADLKKTGQNNSERLEKLQKMADDVARLSTAYTDVQAEQSELKKKNEELEIKSKDLETRLNRANEDPTKKEFKTPGQLVTEGLKDALDNRVFDARQQVRRVKFPFSVKDLVTEVQGVQLIRNERLAGVMMLPDLPLTIRSIIPTLSTNSNMIEYVRESVITNNAGPQYSAGGAGVSPFRDGALKNRSNITYTMANAPIIVIAHYMKASKTILDDVPQLQGMINSRLLYMLALEEEEEILLGDGTAGKLTGLLALASDYDTDYNNTGDTKIDQIRHGMLQVTASKYMPTNIVLHPEDWHDIELVKTDEGSTGNRGSYLVGNPVNGTTVKRLWGLPVLDSLNMVQNHFLVGNFRLGAAIFDRQEANVQIANTNEDDFIRNMITILAEERLGLAVYRPDAFVEGTFA